MVKEKLKSKMCVIKRDGRKEPVHFDKITSRIQKLCYGLNMDFIDPPAITFKVSVEFKQTSLCVAYMWVFMISVPY